MACDFPRVSAGWGLLLLVAGCAAPSTPVFQRAKVVIDDPTLQPPLRIVIAHASHPDYQRRESATGEMTERLHTERGLRLITDEGMGAILQACEEAGFWTHAQALGDPEAESERLLGRPGVFHGYVALDVDGRRGAVMRFVPQHLVQRQERVLSRYHRDRPDTLAVGGGDISEAQDRQVKAAHAMSLLVPELLRLANAHGVDMLSRQSAESLSGDAPRSRGRSGFLAGAEIQAARGSGDELFGTPTPTRAPPSATARPPLSSAPRSEPAPRAETAAPVSSPSFDE